MEILSEAHVIQVFKEEHEKRLSAIREEIDMYFNHGNDVDNVISPELKVMHKSSGIRYTPEGDLVKVSQAQLEKDFEID
jgi:hypothetical protein